MSQPLSVLIIDDEWLNRELLQAYLPAPDYHCEEAATGYQAFLCLEHYLPDVILLDLRLPDMSGAEICRVIRTNPRTAAIPILVLSALDDPFSRSEALAAGVNAFLKKPFDSKTLYSSIQKLVAPSSN